MKPILRRGAWAGAGAGLLAIAIVVMVAMLGEAPAGGSGERLIGLSILLTQIGKPLPFTVAQFADAVGSDSPLFSLTNVLLLASILIEWTLAGLVAAWAISLLQRVRAR